MTIESTAAGTCRVFKREDLPESGWVILSLVYMNWVRDKEIKPISELPKIKKLEYWNMTKKEWRESKRIMVVQALYIYDLITERFKN